MLPQLLRPWAIVDMQIANNCEAELRREVAPGHPIWGLEAKALAGRVDCDDVLFLLKTQTTAGAVVHLTWSGKIEKDTRWPTTEIYSSIEEWTEKRMKPDHEEYIA